jgi:hypothetical protein
MSRRILLALAAIFIGIALVLPVYALVESWNEDFANLTRRGNLLDETDLQDYFQETTVRHQTLFTFLAIFEVVLVVLIAITLRTAFKP